MGRRTILQSAVERARKIARKNIFIITGKVNLPYTVRQLKKSKVKRIVVEPFGRNTAPAIGLATLLAFRKDKDSILIAMPSDSLISNEKKFSSAITAAINVADKQEVIVTLGIKPTTATSAYGYIGIDKRPSEIFAKNAYTVTKFIEKPDSERAGKLISDGRYFWNSGIFIFRTSAMMAMLKKYTPALYKGLIMLPDIKKRRRFDMGLKRLYTKLRSDSLDYAILEKSKNIQVIPSDFKWSDLGSFESIAGLAKKGKDGNVIFGKHVGIDTKESLIFSDTGRLVGTVGINDIIVVDTPDAVLVCSRKRAGEIKKLVGKIKKDKRFTKFL